MFCDVEVNEEKVGDTMRAWEVNGPLASFRFSTNHRLAQGQEVKRILNMANTPLVLDRESGVCAILISAVAQHSANHSTHEKLTAPQLTCMMD